jgi:tRNA C32,U32 (ribose-2'-O)-methylase TrmJ
VALLFGREDKGLSNDALDRCHRVVTIPTEPSYASLNLGHAAIDFFKTRNAEGIMRTMRELAHRTPLDLREVKLLRAMAIEVVKYGERLARSRLHVDR